MKQTHKFTSDQKREWWGYGEWCEEPDLVEFEHCDLKCKVVRQAHPEPFTEEFHMFGGHLTGYVSIGKDHPDYEKGWDNRDLEVHGGITFANMKEDGLYWIGFDCAHSDDYLPSTVFLKKKYLIDDVFPIFEQFKNSPIFNSTYKNINYAICECKNLAEQLATKKQEH